MKWREKMERDAEWVRRHAASGIEVYTAPPSTEPTPNRTRAELQRLLDQADLLVQQAGTIESVLATSADVMTKAFTLARKLRELALRPGTPEEGKLAWEKARLVLEGAAQKIAGLHRVARNAMTDLGEDE